MCLFVCLFVVAVVVVVVVVFVPPLCYARISSRLFKVSSRFLCLLFVCLSCLFVCFLVCLFVCLFVVVVVDIVVVVGIVIVVVPPLCCVRVLSRLFRVSLRFLWLLSV